MKTYESDRYPDAGTPSYIISKSWLSKYKKYVFYDALKYNRAPEPQDDHMQAKHPGAITNAPLLQSEAKYLKGTGKIAGFESEVIDTYLHKEVREKQDFEFVSEEIWQMLNTRYGSDQVIKRFYASRGNSVFSSSLTEIDSRFKWIPVFIVRADDLINSRVQADSFKISYAQISGKKSFNDLKKRLTDIVTAQVQLDNADSAPLKPTDVRLWLADDRDKLTASFEAIGSSEQPMQVDN